MNSKNVRVSLDTLREFKGRQADLLKHLGFPVKSKIELLEYVTGIQTAPIPMVEEGILLKIILPDNDN